MDKYWDVIMLLFFYLSDIDLHKKDLLTALLQAPNNMIIWKLKATAKGGKCS